LENKIMDSKEINGHLLVTGSHRSGSTFVGHVIAKSRKFTYMSEPFHYEDGIRGVEHWFPYATVSKPNYYSRQVDEFFNLEFEYKYHRKGSILRRIYSIVTGTDPSLKSKYFKTIGKLYSNMLIKDPLSAFLSNYMQKYQNVSVLILVRHPLAFYTSLKRLGFRFDFKSFLTQEDLMEDFLKDEESLIKKNNLSYEEEVGLLWRCIYKILTSFYEENRDNKKWLLKKHEDICLNPIVEFEDIFRFLGLKFDKSVKNYIRKCTKSNNPVEAPKNKEHYLFRDSSQLANYWKAKVEKEAVNVIRKITEDVAIKYYNESTWNV